MTDQARVREIAKMIWDTFSGRYGGPYEQQPENGIARKQCDDLARAIAALPAPASQVLTEEGVARAICERAGLDPDKIIPGYTDGLGGGCEAMPRWQMQLPMAREVLAIIDRLTNKDAEHD